MLENCLENYLKNYSKVRKGRKELMVKSKKVTSDDFSYEAKVAEIDGIIAKIEAGTLDLAEVFEQFATAVQYIKECDSFLQAKQEQVDILIETLQDESSE